ncbi:MAG: hypothetical protein R6X18_20645 [Chloroflexota bacterium]|jgi:hypothetical protein
MVQNKDNLTTPRGVLATLSAGFDLATRYLWLMAIPALLDIFLWIGPRLSFRPLIDTLISSFPTEATVMDPRPMLEAIAPFLNQFSYLSVTLLGVPALMAGLSPEQTPITPVVIESTGWAAWIGTLALFTLLGLFLAAVYFSLIAAMMRRIAGPDEETDSSKPLLLWIGRTWVRLIALALLFILLILAILLPFSLVAGFIALLSQTLATFVLIGAFILMVSLGIFMGYTPQGMTLNPRNFLPAVSESVQLFQRYLSPALTLLFIIFTARRLLSWILLAADSGTWVTAVNILAHAYISTALVAALFIFYRDRYQLFQQENQLRTSSEPLKQ